jgi:hypothetical protein
MVIYHAASKRALRAIVDRTKDVNANLRKEAFSILGRRVTLKAIKRPDLVDLIKRGLTDRNGKFRKTIFCQFVFPLLQGNVSFCIF